MRGKIMWLLSGMMCIMLMLQVVAQASGALTITTVSSGNVTGTSADLTGAVYSDGTETVTSRGFYFGTNSDPTVSDSTYTAATAGTGQFTGSLTNLSPNTTYYFKAYASGSTYGAYGNTLSFTTLALATPAVSSLAYSNITYNSVTLDADVTSQGDAAVTERGFYYSTTNTPPTVSDLNNTNTLVVSGTTGTMNGSLTTLQQNTTYYIWAYAKNAGGLGLTSMTSITTLPFVLPTVNSLTYTNVVYNGVTLDANVTSEGDGPVTERGFFYSMTNTPPTPSDLSNSNTLVISGTTGPMNGSLTTLQASTTYYIWAYAKNAGGLGLTSMGTIATPAFAVPTVNSLAYTNVVYNGVTLDANVTSEGDGPVTERGFYYSTTNTPPTVSDLTYTNTFVVSGTTGPMNGSLTTLQSNMTYYIWAYAKNAGGLGLTSMETITTPAIVLPTVNSLAYTNLVYNGVTLDANVTSGGNAPITERGFYYSKTNTPPNQSDLSSTNTFVVSGTTGPMNGSLTTLEQNTTYYIWAYAKNAGGLGLTSMETITTPAFALPLVNSLMHTNVVYNGVTLDANVTSQGDGPITERGFYYSKTNTPPNPSDLSSTNTLVVSGTTGPMNGSLTTLQESTTYYIWAYAKNSGGLGLTSMTTITTPAFALPTVNSLVYSNLAGTSVKLDANVVSEGDGAVTERGFYYALTNTPPTLGDLNISNTLVVSGTTGAMTGNLTGLQSSTTYYVWAYAKNSGGIGFSPVQQFTTLFISSTAELTGLAPTNLTLTPTVTSLTYTYSSTVGNGIRDFELTPSLVGQGATVRISVKANGSVVGSPITKFTGQSSGSLPLAVGTNVITIEVVAENGNVTGTYTLTIIRKGEDSPAPSPGGGGVSTGSSSKITVTVTDPTTGGVKADARITQLVGPQLSLSAQLQKPDGTSLNLPDISVSPTGSFSLPNVPAGEYKMLMNVVAPTGEKLAGRVAKLTVSSDGSAKLEAELIDPYGVITDALTGKPIDGVTATVYWADTDLNRSKGRKPGTPVVLPELPDFPPNKNHNPQISIDGGKYGWMVFPDGDYYIIGVRDGYEQFDSRNDKRDEQHGDDSYVRNGLIHVGVSIVEFSFKMTPTNVHRPYMEGYGNSEFRPEGSLTRAELATILNRIIPAGEAVAEAATFSDTNDHWAAAAIDTASRYGWVTGYPSGEFVPDRAITRAEFAQVLSNIKKWNPATGSSFSDVSEHWGLPAIGAAENQGLLSGYPDGTFQPDKNVTRAEAVTVFNKLLGRAPHMMNPTAEWSDVPVTYWGFGDIMEASILHPAK